MKQFYGFILKEQCSLASKSSMWFCAVNTSKSTFIMNIRNIAIIAHVDHGKTTIVDGLLKQSKTFRDNESEMNQDLILDSNDQERERGITILAKNTAVIYKDTKINIIDTPGHSDFGGEVERTLNMADGALFLELATEDSQLDFATLFAIGREGSAWRELADYIAHSEELDTKLPADLSAIFEAILKYIPQPKTDDEGPFQMLVTSLDWDNYKGKYAIGRITRGTARAGDQVVLLKSDGTKENTTIEKAFVNQGLKRVETDRVTSGDIVSITGIKNAGIGDTIADASNPEAMPTIHVDEPTLSMSIGPNTSPFMGKEGKFFTSRQILERCEREMQTNIAMRFKVAEDGQYIISGRGE